MNAAVAYVKSKEMGNFKAAKQQNFRKGIHEGCYS
jgi:hypothetical protein